MTMNCVHFELKELIPCLGVTDQMKLMGASQGLQTNVTKVEKIHNL
jgi:hypothetical protein